MEIEGLFKFYEYVIVVSKRLHSVIKIISVQRREKLNFIEHF